MRRNQNFSHGERYFGELGLEGDIGKYLEATVYYRYNQRYFPQYSWNPVHRVYTDLSFKYDWSYFSLSERFRLTLDKNPAFMDDPDPEATGRTKTQLQYNIRKTPLLIRTAVEFFAPLSRQEELYTEKSRYILGMVYVINPSLSLEASHYYERDRYRNRPLYKYLWVIRLHYDL